MKLRDYKRTGPKAASASRPKSIEEALKRFERQGEETLQEVERSRERQRRVLKQVKHVQLVKA